MVLLKLKDSIFGGIVSKILNNGIMVSKRGVEVFYSQQEVESAINEGKGF